MPIAITEADIAYQRACVQYLENAIHDKTEQLRSEQKILKGMLMSKGNTR